MQAVFAKCLVLYSQACVCVRVCVWRTILSRNTHDQEKCLPSFINGSKTTHRRQQHCFMKTSSEGTKSSSLRKVRDAFPCVMAGLSLDPALPFSLPGPQYLFSLSLFFNREHKFPVDRVHAQLLR